MSRRKSNGKGAPRAPEAVPDLIAEGRIDHYRALILHLKPDTYTQRDLRNCLDVEHDDELAASEVKVAASRIATMGRGVLNADGLLEILPLADQPDEDPDAGEPNDAEAPEEIEVLPPVGHLGTPTRYLRHTLTASEREELRVEREEEDARIEQLTADLESLKKQAKHTANEIEILASKGLEKSRVIRLGWRMQDVPCEGRRELDKREDSPTKDKLVMVTYRLDTFEPIDWRPLTYAERQGVLFDEAPAKTPSDGVEVRGNGAAKAEATHLLSEAVSP